MPSKDLSEFHQQVSNMFPWPKTADEWDQYRLSNDQLYFFLTRTDICPASKCSTRISLKYYATNSFN